MDIPTLALLLIVSLNCTLEVSSTYPECHSSTLGKEFVFGIIQPISNIYPSTHITLDIYSEQSGSIHLDAAYIQLNKTYYVSAGTHLNIPITHSELGGTFQQHRGIRILTSTDISVLLSQANEHEFKTSHFILPSSALGRNYVAASYRPHYNGFTGRIMVVATENHSDVMINVNGSIIHVTLDELEVYQYQSEIDGDVSGTIIQSNNPVAVTTACLTNILTLNFNVIVAQMVPVSSWSKEFIVASNKLIVLRILAETNTINLSFRNQSTEINITQNSITDYIFDSGPLTVVADRPVFVVQYMTNPPAMLTVPGVDHFANNYAFIMPYKDDALSSYVAITVPSDQAAGLLYNGVSFHKSLQQVSVPFINYVVTTFNTTTETIHKVSHVNSSVNFGLMATRYDSSNHFAFGFYVGSNVEGNCNMNALQTTPSMSTTMPSTTMPSTTRPSTTILSTTMPSTTAQFTTSMPGLSTVSNQGHICYSCEGMSHLQYCDRVVRCQGNEKCFVQRYTQSGEVIFRSGCMLTETCQLHITRTNSALDGCVTCCDGNVCNGKGCNDNGLPSIDNRGPVCYDCEHVGSPDECHLVTLCDIDQKCMVEKFRWGSGFHYKLGCGSQTCSLRSRRDVYEPATRSLPVCHKCCKDDICNRDCSSHTSPEIVG